MRRDVRGRVILITGASRGIGKRAAERLAKLGAKVAITGRSVADLAQIVRELRSTGAEVESFPADLTLAADRERLVQRVVAHFVGLDILINCAGVSSFGEFATSEETINRKVMEINFFAAIELIRVCVPHLTASGMKGHQPAVLNVASICGRCGIPSLPEHCASKHAFVGLTESLRGEFVRYGIDVLLLLPGLVHSDDLNRHLLRNEGKIYLNFEGAQPADEVADGLVRSLLGNRREAAIGFVAWWVWFGKRMFPRVVRFIMKRKVLRFARQNDSA